jgi:hypothetical protein
MRLLLALALLVLAAMPAAGQTRPEREMVAIRESEPVSLRADRAYLLFRTVRPDGVPTIEPIFLRIPTAAELERYEAARREAYRLAEPGLIRRREAQLRRNAEIAASGRRFRDPVDPPPSLATFAFAYGGMINVYNVNHDRAFVRGRPESVYLIEAVPGDYVLYGASFGATPARLFTCMCLGTVGFSAQPGVVTDLGHFLADAVVQVSTIPELRAESGFGPTMSVYMPLIGATVRPAPPGLAVPAALRGADVRAAAYRAVGKFIDTGAMSVNRLVPVPGVLAYDGGRVIDVASGRVAPDAY